MQCPAPVDYCTGRLLHACAQTSTLRKMPAFAAVLAFAFTALFTLPVQGYDFFILVRCVRVKCNAVRGQTLRDALTLTLLPCEPEATDDTLCKGHAKACTVPLCLFMHFSEALWYLLADLSGGLRMAQRLSYHSMGLTRQVDGRELNEKDNCMCSSGRVSLLDFGVPGGFLGGLLGRRQVPDHVE